MHSTIKALDLARHVNIGATIGLFAWLTAAALSLQSGPSITSHDPGSETIGYSVVTQVHP